MILNTIEFNDLTFPSGPIAFISVTVRVFPGPNWEIIFNCALVNLLFVQYNISRGGL